MPTLAISNTSPILNLATVGYLHLLRSQFGRIIVPRAVVEELRLDEDYTGNNEITSAIDKGWIEVRSVTNRNRVRVLQHTLDDGEAETIALALETASPLVLLDEKDARGAAKDLGLKTTGVVGIIMRAFKQGNIEEPLEVMRDLREKAGFYLSDTIMTHIQSTVKRSR